MGVIWQLLELLEQTGLVGPANQSAVASEPMEGHHLDKPFLSSLVPQDRPHHRSHTVLEELLALQIEEFLHKLFPLKRQGFLC